MKRFVRKQEKCKLEKRTIKTLSLEEATAALRYYYKPQTENRARPKFEATERDLLLLSIFLIYEAEGKPTLDFKFIQKETKQPPAYLRRTLREIADELSPGKFTIKPEYITTISTDKGNGGLMGRPRTV